MVRGEGGGTGATALGRGAGRQRAEEPAGSRQLWDEPKPHPGPSEFRPHCRAGPRAPGAAREMRAGDGVRGYECGQASPLLFLCVGKQVCFAAFVVLPFTCFSKASGKTYPSVRIGVTSPTACAALIKWLCSRGFDLFLKRAQRCLLPPSHQQAKLSLKALGSVAAAQGGLQVQSFCSPSRAGGHSHGQGSRP